MKHEQPTHVVTPEKPTTDGKADSVSTLADSVSPPSVNSEESTNNELQVNLGYADFSHEYDETDSSELEEIQTLALDEVVEEDDEYQKIPQHDIATLEAIVFEGVTPPPQQRQPSSAKPAVISTEQPALTKTAAPSPVPHTAPPAYKAPLANKPLKPLPQKSNNPFLPQHILDRLNQGNRNLVEEIAQSGAALDASTAILRTRAKADRLNKSASPDYRYQEPAPQDRTTVRKQKLIDDLVDEYLPLLAAELRKRLKRILDE